MLIDCEYDLLKELRDINQISVYGLGHASGILSDWLDKHSISIASYIVSDKASVHTGGMNILSVDEVEAGKQPILVGVTSKYRTEIERLLLERGFKNIITLTDECIEKIDLLKNRGLYFQIHITDHCNLKCRGCYHFSSLANESYLSLEEFEKDIKRLSELFNGKAERILLLGGEPLLHPDVERFFYIARKYFPQGTLQLLTNGLLLLKMRSDFYNSARENNVEVWVTKYPVAFDYEKAEGYANSFGVDIHYFNKEPVRTLGHQPLDINGGQNGRENFIYCYRANECIDLKHGRMYPCIIPAEIKPFCDYFELDIPVVDEDSVDIYSVSTGMELLDKLKKPIPFCRFCNRDSVKIFGEIPWERTSFDVKEWTD